MIGLRDRVYLLQGGGVDRFGDPLPVVRRGPMPAAVSPLSSEEYADYSASTKTVLRCILGPTLPTGATPIKATDKIELAGVVYQVQGQPGQHRLNGRVHHLEVQLVRTTG